LLVAGTTPAVWGVEEVVNGAAEGVDGGALVDDGTADEFFGAI
jgi:hypothetical protein